MEQHCKQDLDARKRGQPLRYICVRDNREWHIRVAFPDLVTVNSLVVELVTWVLDTSQLIKKVHSGLLTTLNNIILSICSGRWIEHCPSIPQLGGENRFSQSMSTHVAEKFYHKLMVITESRHETERRIPTNISTREKTYRRISEVSRKILARIPAIFPTYTR